MHCLDFVDIVFVAANVKDNSVILQDLPVFAVCGTYNVELKKKKNYKFDSVIIV